MKERYYGAALKNSCQEISLWKSLEICISIANQDTRGNTDRASKLRSVIQALQQTFMSDYSKPSIISFGEAMLPSRSSYNPTRVYLKDKPHKWGTIIHAVFSSLILREVRKHVLLYAV